MKLEVIDGIEQFLGDVVEVTADDLNKLENIIEQCNRASNAGEQIVSDAIYDKLVSELSYFRPNSGVLHQLWEEDGDVIDDTEILKKNPMRSILTIKSYGDEELARFVNHLPTGEPLFASMKINGHGVRVVYRNGHLVSATSRARASGGRDLTRQMKNILGGYNDALRDYDMVEVRGEVCLPYSRLGAARGYNPGIKSAFSGVSSLIKPSSTEGENKLLDFLAYGFLTLDGMVYDSKQEEYAALDGFGFKTPLYAYCDDEYIDIDYIADIVEALENMVDDYDYFTDGVVIEVDDRETFRSLGDEGKYANGNVAMKVGYWRQDLYTGIVEDIIYTRGKHKLSPVAIVREEGSGEGVLTAQGNRVRRVPLYEPKNIILLDAYTGEPLCFRYGGEAGVVPCYPTGTLLTEDTINNVSDF